MIWNGAVAILGSLFTLQPLLILARDAVNSRMSFNIEGGRNLSIDKETWTAGTLLSKRDWTKGQPPVWQSSQLGAESPQDPRLVSFWYDSSYQRGDRPPERIPDDAGVTASRLLAGLVGRLSAQSDLYNHQYSQGAVGAIRDRGYALIWEWVNQRRIDWPTFGANPDHPLPLETSVMIQVPGGTRNGITLRDWIRQLALRHLLPPVGENDPELRRRWTGYLEYGLGNYALSYEIVGMQDRRVLDLHNERPDMRQALSGLRDTGQSISNPPRQEQGRTGDPVSQPQSSPANPATATAITVQ